jgi:type IV secretory pathway component VirB8
LEIARVIDEIVSPAAYKAAQVNNILLTRVVATLTIIVIAEAIAIISLFPLKDTKVKVVEFIDGASNFVRVTEPSATIQGDAILIDYFVKKYIVDRESWDHITEEERLPYIRAVSSDKVWNDMRALFTNPKSPHMRNDFKRAVRILRVSSVTQSIRQVEFETTDTYGAGNTSQRAETAIWIATLKMSFAARSSTYDEADLNPLGLVVEEYSIAKRKVQ